MSYPPGRKSVRPARTGSGQETPVVLDRPAHRSDQIALLGVLVGPHPEAVRQPIPIRRVECDDRPLPEVPPELG